MTGSAIALVGLALLAAVGGFLAWRGERARSRTLGAELAGLREAVEAERSATETKATERRERGDEMAELRRRLEKAKRRAFTAH